ncbi:MAG: valine--pyruvate transaminase [Gammaproteobacteria bacterium]
MKFSKFAQRFTEDSGIFQLMEDLGNAMAGDQDVLMLGGGNPAHIPAVQSLFQERMRRLVEDPEEFAHTIGNYDTPRGEQQFIRALADLLRSRYGWPLGPENIVLTSGSQSGFFLLFNTLAGEFPDGTHKQILLPVVPEYIGYSDVGLTDDLFIAHRPTIETFADHTFKYHVAFDELNVDESIGAICVSRPTNPTGNVLSDQEVAKLLHLAEQRQIPLIIDNAYGMPFPNIIFADVKPVWSEQIIYCMSLSKLGLPAVRTGIIIAHRDITDAIAKMNGIINLALGSFGPALALDLVQSGEVIYMSETVIKPFYQTRAQQAIELFHKELAGIDYYIHKAEGAIFLWLWFPGLPISSEELYVRLKKRGVLILSGHYFFPGLDDDWKHKHECIRVTYAMEDEVVSQGIRIIAEEVKKVVF